MDKRFWIAGIVASVLVIALGFVVHAVLLTDDYMNYKHLFRTEEDAMANMPLMMLAHIIMGFALAWIYGQGVKNEGSWLGQGLRFGIATTLLVTVPWYLIYYSVQPWGRRVIAKQIVLDGISMIIVSLVVAYIYKSKGTTVEV